MIYVLTLATPAPLPLTDDHIRAAISIALPDGNAAITRLGTQAADNALITKLRAYLDGLQIDFFLTPAAGRRKKLLIADMDSTMVRGETLDDLAKAAGLKEKIAAITQQAMEGGLDFAAAVRERVGLLKGLKAAAIAKAAAAMEFNPGAETLIKTMKANGARCILVSGGFTQFTEPAAARLGFDHHHGNSLIIENDILTGAVREPIQDKHGKVRHLNQYAAQWKVAPGDTMAIGDGANDLPMLKAAGLGIGYRPKPLLADSLTNLIRHGDLTAALYAQGYREEDLIK